MTVDQPVASPCSIPSIDGAIVIHKPVGPTSHDVVVCARRALGISRIGHTGTLDPQASGVLPLVLGQATRLAQHLTGTDKEYIATVRFGVTSDTYDASGEVAAQDGELPSAAAVTSALDRFRGTFEQAPPLYSAKMVGGERSYVRARAGKPMQPAAATVTAHEIELLEFDRGAGAAAGAVLGRLLRPFAGARRRPGGRLRGDSRRAGADRGGRLPAGRGGPVRGAGDRSRAMRSGRAVRPMEGLLAELPSVTLTAEGVRWARHGRDLGPRDLVRPLAGIAATRANDSPEGRLLGLAEPAKSAGFLHPAVVFSYN